MHLEQHIIVILCVMSLMVVLSTHFVRPINPPRLFVALGAALIPWLFPSITMGLIVALALFVFSILLSIALVT